MHTEHAAGAWGATNTCLVVGRLAQPGHVAAKDERQFSRLRMAR